MDNKGKLFVILFAVMNHLTEHVVNTGTGQKTTEPGKTYLHFRTAGIIII
jgi:hypothetical protein